MAEVRPPTVHAPDFHNLVVVRQLFYSSRCQCSKRECRNSPKDRNKILRKNARCSLPLYLLYRRDWVWFWSTITRYGRTNQGPTLCRTCPSSRIFPRSKRRSGPLAMCKYSPSRNQCSFRKSSFVDYLNSRRPSCISNRISRQRLRAHR